MTISLPPTAPSRQDPATFSDRADAFASWLVGAVPQFNALAVGSIDTGNFQNITVSGQITGNAVTQSPTDTTAGRLLKVGDFGLGRTIDAPEGLGLRDFLHPVGWFRTTGDTPNRDDAPYGDVFYTYRVENTGSERRRFTIFKSNDPSYYREVEPGSQGPWIKIYDSASILGTVSQSSGVPTGAVIERGSNSNGAFVRLADGTQICTRNVIPDPTTLDQIESTDIFSGEVFEWDYPAQFTSGTGVAAFADLFTDDIARWAMAMNDDNTSARIIVFRAGGSAFSEGNRRLRLFAIGRWF